ncbi:fibrobacter succinogenes major paralogous domain-containing protein, partial [Dolichospermum sp. ST_sed4]|nr:fibrobacter succinogenes major paralogous domain-containing protein [Dolichospermum sp. ST_sed4]
GGGQGTNISRFSALLSGGRYGGGNFYYFGIYATFWSSTEIDATFVTTLVLNNNDIGIVLATNVKGYGFSVRCLKD